MPFSVLNKCFQFLTHLVLVQDLGLRCPLVRVASMAPKRRPGRRAARVAARAVQVQASNQRRDTRKLAVKTLNALAHALDLPSQPLLVKTATSAQVEALIRVLEHRLSDSGQMRQLRAAAKQWADAGGILSTTVLAEDMLATPVVTRHRVLAPNFTLKSKAFMLTHNDLSITPACWLAYKDFVVDLKRKFGARGWAASLEESLNSEDDNRHHCHGYLLWTDGVGIQVRDLGPFYFMGIRPRIDVCTTRSPTTSPHAAACHGMWYVSFAKDGTLQNTTNYPPGQWYKPHPQWLQSLYTDGKLRFDKYIAASAKWFPVGHGARKRDAEEALRDQRQQSVNTHVENELKALRAAGAYYKPKTYPEVEEFVAHFLPLPVPLPVGPVVNPSSMHGLEWRRPALLLVGGTNMGKSMLGGAILQRIGEALSLPEATFLEISVEDDAHLDLAELDILKHGGVLLDGVADVRLLKKHRETLQGRPKISKGARSATMKHAYSFTLARRAVVVTMDLSASNLHLLRTDHWLSDRRNLIVLRLDGATWMSPGALVQNTIVQPPQPTRADEMQGWRVQDVVGFMEEADLHGPASVLFANGVDGRDLVNLDAHVLTTDFRMSSFAARKILKARDNFLAA